MIWVQFVKNYLSDFATKNLEKLSEAYDDRVQLRDWLISVEGKGAVLDANKQLFDNCDNISVQILNTAYRDKFVCVEFNLSIDDKVLHVVDIIEVNDEGKIKSIRAYKG
mgnify:CR=1 FL=1